MDAVVPRTLNLLSVTQFFDQTSQLKPDAAIADQDSDWKYRVSVVVVSAFTAEFLCTVTGQGELLFIKPRKPPPLALSAPRL